MKRAILAIVLIASLTAAGGMGDADDFWADFSASYYGGIELLFVDYASGEPVLAQLNPYMDEPRALDVHGRFPAGMGLPAVGGAFTNPHTLVREVPGEGGWALEVIPHYRFGDVVAVLAGPGEDLQPAVFGNRCVAFSRENEDGGYDIALWTENSGVKVLDLGPGDEMWPTFFYAASAEELAPPDADPYTFEPAPGEINPLNEPSAIIFQADPDGAFRLHYALLGPGGEVERTGELTGEGLDGFEGEMLCPDIPNQYWGEPDYAPDGPALLAFQGLADGNRDLYLTEVRRVSFEWGSKLVAEGLVRLTDWPGDEKFPELFAAYDWEADEPVTWCFFASDRDGDFDVYALWVEKGRFYQLTDLPGTQTAPLALLDTEA
jgi:hypothetical protein